MEFHGNSYLPRGFHIQKDVENHHGGVSPFGFHDLQMVGGCYWSRVRPWHGIQTDTGWWYTYHIVVNILLIMVNIWLLYG